MREIIIWGRGGQGAVTAAQILAIAAFYDGRQSQAFPSFGVERRGAPVTAFARISDRRISERSQIYSADYVVVLDASLLEAVDVSKSLKKGGAIIINSAKKTKINNFKTCSVDASSVALKIFGRDIVNTAMVAAFARFTKEISEEAAKKAVDDVFRGEVAEKNKQAITEVWQKTK
jgi:pyruvate ferredoxin oxidoreductase gamma subunit